MRWNSRSPGVRAALGAGLVCVATVPSGHVSPAKAADRPGRLERQVRVMERVLDEMLVDSPNFLVRSHEPTAGFEMEDSGVVFAFEATLTGPGWQSGGLFSDFFFWDGRHHRPVVILDEGEEDDDVVLVDNGLVVKDGEVYEVRKGGKLKKASGDWEVIDQKTYRERAEQKYEKARGELIDALLDAGDLLTAVPAGQTVRIDCRFDGVKLPGDREVKKLSVRANIDDLRAHSDGRLSDDEARKRIDVRES